MELPLHGGLPGASRRLTPPPGKVEVPTHPLALPAFPLSCIADGRTPLTSETLMPTQTFKSKDEVPQEFAETAIEAKDGTFHVFTDEDTGGLKSALQKEREASRKAKKEAADAQERLSAIEAENKEAELAKHGLKDVKRKWAEEELAPVSKERDAFKAKYLERALAGEIKAMLNDIGVVDVEGAYRLLGADYELGDEEKPVLKRDPTADVRKSLEKVLNDRYKYLLKGTQAAGGGAAGAKGAGGGGGQKPPTQWSVDERRAFIDQHGMAEYQKLLDAEGLARLTAKRAA